jgi:hypothetical protein
VLNAYKEDGSLFSSSNVNISNFNASKFYSCNIPLFSSLEAAVNYLNTLDASAALNGLAYDYPALADSVAEALEPLADIKINPNALPALSTAVAEAALAVPDPDPASDPDANNDVYKVAVAQAVTASVPALAPEADPDAETDPEPGTDSDLDIGGSNISNYKYDLSSVFPFCLPFDLVKLLQALDADPVAPCFELPFVVPPLGIDITYTLDFSIFNDLMVYVRLGELVTFIIVLIMATGKLIKW